MESKLRSTILASSDLPTLPAVANQLLILTAREETSFAEIADLIAQDPALSVKILRAGNSSFYGFSGQINSIQHAVSFLGINAVRTLVLSFSFLSMKSTKKSRFDFALFWERSLAGAAAAKVIAEQVADVDQEELFIAGLLRNIGELVFARTVPDQYEAVISADLEEDGEVEKKEREHLGITHSVAGYEVTKQWGVPEAFIQSIRWHNNPRGYTVGDEKLTRIIIIVYLADLLAKIFHCSAPEHAHKLFRREAKALLGFNVLTINAILKKVGEDIKAATQCFGLQVPPTRSVAEILEEANQRLSLLNLSYEKMNRELVQSKMQLEKLSAELKNKNAILENIAYIDHLTEVANHRAFQERLALELQRAADTGGNLSLLLMDIDHFKRINDTYGHMQGDTVLKEFCHVTRQILRNYDLLARYGGEEFAVLLPGTPPEEAIIVAEKIRCHVEKHLYCEGVDNIRITVSIGCAGVLASDGQVKNDLLIAQADEVLYKAKRTGRNRSICYQPNQKKSWLWS